MNEAVYWSLETQQCTKVLVLAGAFILVGKHEQVIMYCARGCKSYREKQVGEVAGNCLFYIVVREGFTGDIDVSVETWRRCEGMNCETISKKSVPAQAAVVSESLKWGAGWAAHVKCSSSQASEEMHRVTWQASLQQVVKDVGFLCVERAAFGGVWQGDCCDHFGA